MKYVTSEQFVTEFIKAVRERQGDGFRQRYREVDILLVDDIQFLAKREETQTEFFHTFNHLHGAGKQIVIASDRPPHELAGLEERLVSRFRWGLCVDVQPPDLETRIAILQLKAERDHIEVPPEVVEFVASKFDQSVRELEGALVRVVAWSELTSQPIDITLGERALQDLIPQTENEIPPQLILEETATYFSLSTGDLMSKSRLRPLTQARHIAMYLMRENTGLSLVKIGEIFGGATTRPRCTASRRSRPTCALGTPRSVRSRTSRAASVAASGVPHEPRRRADPVDNSRPAVHRSSSLVGLGGATCISPPVVPHVSHGRYACRKRYASADFHSAYYYRSSHSN